MRWKNRLGLPNLLLVTVVTLAVIELTINSTIYGYETVHALNNGRDGKST